MSEQGGEERRRRRRRTTDEDGGEQGEETTNPFGAFLMSEAVYDKLKLLGYEEHFCKERGMKPIHKYYFAVKQDGNEQLWMFGALLSWLLSLCGTKYAPPEQYDDPSSILSAALSSLKKAGIQHDVPQSSLRTGFGEEVAQLLNLAAQQAMKSKRWAWGSPVHKHSDMQSEEENGDAVEVTTNVEGQEDDIEEEDDFDDDDLDFIDVDATKEIASSHEKADILKSSVSAAEWKIELERVLPQLKVHIRSDAKDWRNHLSQMQENMTTVSGALGDTKGYLSKLSQEIEKTLNKIASREKYINGQLQALITEYRQSQDSYSVTKERYTSASKQVTEYSQELAALTAELEIVKAEMDERGTSLTDATPLVEIRNSHKALLKEIAQMDMRIGVIQHMLLAAKIRQKGEIVTNMTSNAKDPFHRNIE